MSKSVTITQKKRTMMEEQHFLKSIFNVENFKEEDLDTILSQYRRVELGKNDYFIEEGTTAGYYYFIESGRTRHTLIFIYVCRRILHILGYIQILIGDRIIENQ